MAKEEKFTFLSADGKTTIHAVKWIPEDGKYEAILQITHGMIEFVERYRLFAEFLTENGFMVVGHDHLGHGDSVASKDDWGYFAENPSDTVIADMHALRTMIQKENPGVPYFMMGHSMGSLVVRAYAKEHDQELDALIVCGSPSKNYLRPLGAAVGHAEAAVLGDEHRSNLLEAMSFGSFAARFADEKSRFAWCCSDPEVVREYEENPLCGFTFSDDAFFALNDLLKETYGFHGWHCTNRKLPVLFLSGGDDPCYVNVRRFKKSIDHMRLIGYRNVRGKLYPGMRHEILNEKEKYRVYGDVWKWLKKEKVVENVEGGSTPPQTPDGALAGSGGV